MNIALSEFALCEDLVYSKNEMKIYHFWNLEFESPGCGIKILDTLISHGYIISSWRRDRRSFYDLAEEHNSKLLINQVEKESFFFPLHHVGVERGLRTQGEEAGGGAKKFSRQISSNGTLMTRAKLYTVNNYSPL